MAKTQSITERFWSKVDKSGGPDACWLWMGGRIPSGYGSFWLNGRDHGAHRVAWFLAHGVWPTQHVLHTVCDNPPCVNSAHLKEDDHSANMREKYAKGRDNHARGQRHSSVTHPERVPRGANHWNSKATQEIADEIRCQRAQGMSQSALVRLHGLARGTVADILHYRTWKPPNALGAQHKCRGSGLVGESGATGSCERDTDRRF